MADEKTLDNPAYSDDDKAKIAEVQRWIDPEHGRTGAELSRLTGIKEGTRSSILNGSYNAPPGKFLDRMLDAIQRYTDRRNGRADIPYTDTSISRALELVCRRAQNDRDFGFFAGRVGIGKTTTLRQYVATSPSAILIEAFEGIDHTTFLAELIQATGATVASAGTAASKMAALIRKLKNSERVILVDEANWLPARSFGALRRISDVAEVGVVLVGTAELLPMVQDPDGRFGQISSRIGFWPPVVQKITELDAKALTLSYFDQPPADEVLKAFWLHSEGSARTLRNLLRNTFRNAQKSGTPITAELVIKINNQTMAGRGFTKGV